MRLVLLGRRDIVIGKNNGRRDFRDIKKDYEMKYDKKEIKTIFIYIYILWEIIRKILRIEW